MRVAYYFWAAYLISFVKDVFFNDIAETNLNFTFLALTSCSFNLIWGTNLKSVVFLKLESVLWWGRIITF